MQEKNFINVFKGCPAGLLRKSRAALGPERVRAALGSDGVRARAAGVRTTPWGVAGPPGATGVLSRGVPPVKGVWGAAPGSPPQAPIFWGFFD